MTVDTAFVIGFILLGLGALVMTVTFSYCMLVETLDDRREVRRRRHAASSLPQTREADQPKTYERLQ